MQINYNHEITCNNTVNRRKLQITRTAQSIFLLPITIFSDLRDFITLN